MYQEFGISKEIEELSTKVEKDVEKVFKDIEKMVSEEVPLIVVANQSSYSMYRHEYYDGWMKTYAYQQAEQNRLSFMSR